MNAHDNKAFKTFLKAPKLPLTEKFLGNKISILFLRILCIEQRGDRAGLMGGMACPGEGSFLIPPQRLKVTSRVVTAASVNDSEPQILFFQRKH